MDSLQREEERLAEQLECGQITLQEFNQELKELHREYREQAEESAQEAYDREFENWYPY